MKVELSPEHEAIVNRLVASGAYKNASEVLGAMLEKVSDDTVSDELIAFLHARQQSAYSQPLISQSVTEMIAEIRNNG